MQFESKNKRNFWINSIFGMTPDVLVAAAITAYNSEGFVTFLLVFLGLQIVYLLIWIKNTVWAWVFYKYKGRKQVSDFFFDYLKKNRQMSIFLV
jgi:hypothetical protein